MGHSRLRWSRPRLVHVRFNSDSDRQPSRRDRALRATFRLPQRSKCYKVHGAFAGGIRRPIGEIADIKPWASPLEHVVERKALAAALAHLGRRMRQALVTSTERGQPLILSLSALPASLPAALRVLIAAAILIQIVGDTMQRSQIYLYSITYSP
jgi:hypothetical protein